MIFCQILSMKSLSKCMEISLKNLNALDISIPSMGKDN